MRANRQAPLRALETRPPSELPGNVVSITARANLEDRSVSLFIRPNHMRICLAPKAEDQYADADGDAE